jgi:hypothetical protein
MPTYVLLSTLTPEGRQTLHKNPDRFEEVNKEMPPLVVRSWVSMRCWAFIENGNSGLMECPPIFPLKRDWRLDHALSAQ